MVMQLVKPEEKYLSSVYEAVDEYKSKPSNYEISIVKKMIEATEHDDFTSYFKNIENEALGIGLKPNYVAQTVYWLIDDDQYIGSFALRHSLTSDLEKIGGHIAYQIRPSKQRQGYAYGGLKCCLKNAYHRGLEKVLITCNAKNKASYGVMHKAMSECGGYEDSVFMKGDLVEKRVWVETQKIV